MLHSPSTRKLIASRTETTKIAALLVVVVAGPLLVGDEQARLLLLLLPLRSPVALLPFHLKKRFL